MSTVEFITALFYEVDEQLRTLRNTPRPTSGPVRWSPWGCSMPSKAWATGVLSLVDTRLSAVVSPAPRAHPALSPLPDPSGLDAVFLAAPTVLGVIDTMASSSSTPCAKAGVPNQIGRKGLSNHRWIVGGKLCLLLNQWGLIVGWACATANVAITTFSVG